MQIGMCFLSFSDQIAFTDLSHSLRKGDKVDGSRAGNAVHSVEHLPAVYKDIRRPRAFNYIEFKACLE